MRKLEKLLGKIFLNLLKLSVIRQDISPGKIDHNSIRNILVIIRHQMGDMLLTTPMLRSLKLQYPEAKIILITKSSTRYTQIFKDNLSITDEVMEYENGFENFINLVKELRDRKIDMAVVPSTVVFSMTNHLLAHYSKAPVRVGAASINTLDNNAAFLLNLKSEFLWESKKVHYIERNLDIIRQLGIQPREKRIRIELPGEPADFAKKYFTENFPDTSRPVIGFHIGAAKSANVWAVENFVKLAEKLAEKYNPYLYISEGPDDSEYVNELKKLFESKSNNGTFKSESSVLKNNSPVIGKLTLLNCAAVIKRLNLFVTNDTGIMHLASGFETPVIALFGSTKAYLWGPIGENKISIQSVSSNINNISVEKVFDVCEQVFRRKLQNI